MIGTSEKTIGGLSQVWSYFYFGWVSLEAIQSHIKELEVFHPFSTFREAKFGVARRKGISSSQIFFCHNLCEDMIFTAMVMLLILFLVGIKLFHIVVCVCLYHVRDGYCGFYCFLFHVSFPCFIGETRKGVMELLNLRQGRSGHVWEKGFNWTLGQ